MTAADRQPEVSPGGRLHAPATLRNRTPIAAVLARWLPSEGLVVELASGTGEHVLHFAAAFPHLVWQPSDPAAAHRRSIEGYRRAAGGANLRAPLDIDVTASAWPLERSEEHTSELQSLIRISYAVFCLKKKIF